jgi:hypothetical protein
VVVAIPVASRRRQAALTDTGVTRAVVEASLAELQALHPVSIDDPDLLQAVRRTAQAPYVATVWLLAPDGRMVYAVGSTARSTAAYATVEQAATDDMRRVLEALPEGTLSDRQRLLLLAASAIRREGAHNDVYRHLLRAVKAPDGSSVALIGVAYEAGKWVPGLCWKLGILGGLAGLVVYWLSLPLWVFLDARARGERAWAWAAFVFLGNLVALMAYILGRTARPQSAASP